MQTVERSQRRSTNDLEVKYKNREGAVTQWLEREFTNLKVYVSNPASASQLLLSRLGQPGSIPALVLPSGDMTARHWKVVTAGRLRLRCKRLPTNSVALVVVVSLDGKPETGHING
ncbi:hypothetical protein CSKR_201130 [Clonorchis sinensis]|uniref:Uncharacterized protein n=1 Tax=Clonorchis sinensis TaxID=79923 RepID=A0A8T1ML75_CLOSI|nr:hypothetical protein CSKR_201130 [Clonorchis sinensis]